MSNVYGEWLKAQRTAAGLTQAQLAQAAMGDALPLKESLALMKTIAEEFGRHV